MAYEEAVSGFVEGGAARDKTSGLTRDDRIHGSLLVINELIMNSSFPDEVSSTMWLTTCIVCKFRNTVIAQCELFTLSLPPSHPEC